jgi:hypothetical protein
METTGKPKATPQSARCPTTAGGRTPFSPVYNTTVPAVVAKAQLACTPWRSIVPPEQTPAQPTAARVRIVPPAETPAQPTAARVRIVPAAETPAQPTAAPKPHSFFEAAARTPHIAPEDDLAAYAPARLAALVARDVGGRRPSCSFNAATCAFDVVSCIAVRTGDSVVEASASRTMAQFHRLRRDLLALMPRLSMSVMRVEALGGGKAPPALPPLPAKSLRRQSVRTAAARDVVTLSREGTARRLATKGPELTTWVRDVLAILRHRLGSRPDARHAPQTRVGQGAAAAAEAEALLVDFLLRDARLSVRRGGRVVVVHDGDEHLVCESLLE